MIPLVGVPQTIAKQLSSYREVFFRAEGSLAYQSIRERIDIK
jgi:hypothetical protein